MSLLHYIAQVRGWGGGGGQQGVGVGVGGEGGGIKGGAVREERLVALQLIGNLPPNLIRKPDSCDNMSPDC